MTIFIQKYIESLGKVGCRFLNSDLKNYLLLIYLVMNLNILLLLGLKIY